VASTQRSSASRVFCYLGTDQRGPACRAAREIKRSKVGHVARRAGAHGYLDGIDPVGAILTLARRTPRPANTSPGPFTTAFDLTYTLEVVNSP
jgi:hypothetical protein